MSFALVFSGQGMQHPAMLPWLAHSDLREAVEASLGTDWRTRLADAAWAGANAHAQLLLTGLGLAAWAQLAPDLAPPVVIAGYSVGELAAFSAAGVYAPQEAVELARVRAAFMDGVGAREPSGLMAVSGLAPHALDALCARFGLVIAIRNDPLSVIVGGAEAALPRAAGAAEQAGAQVTPLNVRIASHTPWMREAARAFAAHIAERPWSAPHTLLLSSVQGRVVGATQARDALAQQIDHGLRWDVCMDAIASRRVSCVLEVGPGQALARLWNQRHPQIPARSVDEFRSAAGVVRWVEQHT